MTEKWNNPDELETLLKTCSARMHYVNRVAGGESKYFWWYAELIRAASKLAQNLDDPDIRADFGDGYKQGRVADPKAEILALLAQQMRDR
ncbi:hypothetical protein [Cognatishimia sp. F0-27]|uniref:hypothetical protein n=1 Tax=Cognatishimia sp. F0-27 TaxID=2816855 RepID=UPI001D0CCC2C|nr:hypothetical protein [Cognatishimia sp. F0-27]MCC1491561.1 hypothetical protein [Cognatishimia sp. F0-27]